MHALNYGEIGIPGQAGENPERVHIDISGPMLRVAADNNSGKRIQEIVMDDMHELSM